MAFSDKEKSQPVRQTNNISQQQQVFKANNQHHSIKSTRFKTDYNEQRQFHTASKLSPPKEAKNATTTTNMRDYDKRSRNALVDKGNKRKIVRVTYCGRHNMFLYSYLIIIFQLAKHRTREIWQLINMRWMWKRQFKSIFWGNSILFDLPRQHQDSW